MPVLKPDDKGIITIEGRELVVRYYHSRPPHLYAIRKNPDAGEHTFEKVVSSLYIPIYSPKRNKSKDPWRHSGQVVYIDSYEEYLNALSTYRFRQEVFKFETELELNNNSEFINIPACFVTQCFLYDLEKWNENPPTFIKSEETGERVLADEGVKPDPLAFAFSYCSSREKQFNKKLGRRISFNRALTEYTKKFL